MIQKIRTAKLPGNCLYSALKLPEKYFAFLLFPLDFTLILAYNKSIKRGETQGGKNNDEEYDERDPEENQQRCHEHEHHHDVATGCGQRIELLRKTVLNIIRRREQTAGCLPTSDWEKVADWNPATGMIEQ